MLKRLLSNGVYPENGPVLNRKIRISNLIALATISVLLSFSPLFFYFLHPFDLLMFFMFMGAALANFPLLKRKKYVLGITANITMAYLYFIWAVLAYGLEANLQYYFLVMCFVVVIFYDNKLVIKLFIALSIAVFFALVLTRQGDHGLLNLGSEFDELKKNVGYANLFVLFILISVLMLYFKNDNLNYQAEVEEQGKIIAEKNKEMTDSIVYAQRIQSALLPDKNKLTQKFQDSYLFFQPKDIVSGDFYWFHEHEHEFYLACGDCTGHGVPGALMSVMGINLLNDIVENRNIGSPAEILEHLRTGIIKALNKDQASGEYKDGMDISLVKINRKKMTCQFSAANNPIYHIRNNSLTEYKATKQPVGYSPDPKPFLQNEINLQKGDTLVLFTDGFADQFGGKTQKKYMYKPFKELLAKLDNENQSPEKILHQEFENWKAGVEQIDDVCVLGLKI